MMKRIQKEFLKENNVINLHKNPINEIDNSELYNLSRKNTNKMMKRIQKELIKENEILLFNMKTETETVSEDDNSELYCLSRKNTKKMIKRIHKDFLNEKKIKNINKNKKEEKILNEKNLILSEKNTNKLLKRVSKEFLRENKICKENVKILEEKIKNKKTYELSRKNTDKLLKRIKKDFVKEQNLFEKSNKEIPKKEIKKRDSLFNEDFYYERLKAGSINDILKNNKKKEKRESIKYDFENHYEAIKMTSLKNILNKEKEKKKKNKRESIQMDNFANHYENIIMGSIKEIINNKLNEKKNKIKRESIKLNDEDFYNHYEEMKLNSLRNIIDKDLKKKIKRISIQIDEDFLNHYENMKLGSIKDIINKKNVEDNKIKINPNLDKKLDNNLRGKIDNYFEDKFDKKRDTFKLDLDDESFFDHYENIKIMSLKKVINKDLAEKVKRISVQIDEDFYDLYENAKLDSIKKVLKKEEDLEKEKKRESLCYMELDHYENLKPECIKDIEKVKVPEIKNKKKRESFTQEFFNHYESLKLDSLKNILEEKKIKNPQKLKNKKRESFTQEFLNHYETLKLDSLKNVDLNEKKRHSFKKKRESFTQEYLNHYETLKLDSLKNIEKCEEEKKKDLKKKRESFTQEYLNHYENLKLDSLKNIEKPEEKKNDVKTKRESLSEDFFKLYQTIKMDSFRGIINIEKDPEAKIKNNKYINIKNNLQIEDVNKNNRYNSNVLQPLKLSNDENNLEYEPTITSQITEDSLIEDFHDSIKGNSLKELIAKKNPNKFNSVLVQIKKNNNEEENEIFNRFDNYEKKNINNLKHSSEIYQGRIKIKNDGDDILKYYENLDKGSLREIIDVNIVKKRNPSAFGKKNLKINKKKNMIKINENNFEFSSDDIYNDFERSVKDLNYEKKIIHEDKKNIEIKIKEEFLDNFYDNLARNSVIELIDDDVRIKIEMKNFTDQSVDNFYNNLASDSIKDLINEKEIMLKDKKLDKNEINNDYSIKSLEIDDLKKNDSNLSSTFNIYHEYNSKSSDKNILKVPKIRKSLELKLNEKIPTKSQKKFFGEILGLSENVPRFSVLNQNSLQLRNKKIWEIYKENYSVKMMKKMNDILQNRKFSSSKVSFNYLKHQMSKMVDKEFIIYLINLEDTEIEKILKIQRFWRKKINQKIMKKIKNGQEFYRKSCLANNRFSSLLTPEMIEKINKERKNNFK